MTGWSGVIEVEYGTIVLADSTSQPPLDLDFEGYIRDHCAAIPGGVQASLPDKNPIIRAEVRVLNAGGSIEDQWEHVAEVGFQAKGGRLQVYSWMPDEDLAAEIDVPTDPSIGRIHWAGLGHWFRLVMAQRHLEASTVLRLRIDLFPGTLESVRTLRSWAGWVPPIQESRGTNGLLRLRGEAARSRRAALVPTGRRFWPPYPASQDGNVTALLRDPRSGSSWAEGFDEGQEFLQELTPDEAEALRPQSFAEIQTYARDSLGRIWSAGLTPLERAPALEYVPDEGWDRVQQILGRDEYQLIDLPEGWGRITRWAVDPTATRDLVTSVEDRGPRDVFQRWPDGAEIPS